MDLSTLAPVLLVATIGFTRWLSVITKGKLFGSLWQSCKHPKGFSSSTIRRTPVGHGLELEEHYFGTERHRKNGPALVLQNKGGSVLREEYFFHNKRHRTDGPAVCTMDGTGTRKEYWQNDQKHREEGPAVIIQMIDGSQRTEFWLEGKLISHSQTRRFCQISGCSNIEQKFGTGIVVTEDNSGTKKEEYYLEGKLHSTTGPARIVTARDGSCWNEFWEQGQLVSVERHLATNANDPMR